MKTVWAILWIFGLILAGSDSDWQLVTTTTGLAMFCLASYKLTTWED